MRGYNVMGDRAAPSNPCRARRVHGHRPILSSDCRRGIALIWTAVMIAILVGIVGLSLGWGRMSLVAHQLKSGADSAALAGAIWVKIDQSQARQNAIALAAQNSADLLAIHILDNPGNDPAGEVVLGRWVRQMRVFIPTTLGPNAVRVFGRRAGQRPEAPQVRWLAFRSGAMDVNCVAIAESEVTTGAGIITLAAQPRWSHAPTGLWMHGTTLVDLRGIDYLTGQPLVGDVQVNAVSTQTNGHREALVVNGTVEIYANELNVVGVAEPSDSDAEGWETFYGDPTYPFSVATDQPRIEDPLGDVPQPTIPPIRTDKNGQPYDYTITSDTIYNFGEEVVDPITGTKTKVLTLDPGYYPGGIDLNTGSRTVQTTQIDPVTGLPVTVTETYELELHLNHGTDAANSTYALAGGPRGDCGLTINGNASMTGLGVTLFITGPNAQAPNVKYGIVDIGGNADLTISPPGDDPSQYNPREVNGAPGVSIWQDRNNTNDARIIGTSDMNLTGTLYFPNNHTEVGGTGFQAGNQLITGSLDLHGTGIIGIGYDGRNRVFGGRSMLVR